MPTNETIKTSSSSIVNPELEGIRSLTVEETKVHIGPIPSPEILRQYESVCNGAADRIIGMAEEESKARHRFNESALQANINDTKRGMYLAAILAFVIIIGSLYLLLTDHYIVGTLFSIPGLGLTYKAFIDKSMGQSNMDE